MNQVKFSTNADYIAFLKNLRQGMNLNVSAVAEASKANLDGVIAKASMDPGEEVTKKSAEVWDNLRKAAITGTQFTYNLGKENERTVDARAEVNRIFVKRINNFLVPMSFALEFFEIQSLPDNGQPYYENETDHEVRISLVGQDGGMRESAVVLSRGQTQIPLWTLASEVVKYQLMDILKGTVADENAKLVNIARDLQLNLDSRLWTALKTAVSGGVGVIGNFTTTGEKRNRTWNLHSTVASDNLPTTNALSDTTDGYFGKKHLDLIFKYAAKFQGLMPDMDLYPTKIYLPTSATLGQLADTTLTMTPNALNEQVLTRGFIQNYLGRNIVYQGVPQFTAASKAAYVRFNRPVGLYFDKPGMMKMLNKRDEWTNEGEMGTKMVWGACVPRQNNPFIVKVTYAS